VAALLNRADMRLRFHFGELFSPDRAICGAVRETPVDSDTFVAFSVVYAT